MTSRRDRFRVSSSIVIVNVIVYVIFNLIFIIFIIFLMVIISTVVICCNGESCLSSLLY